MTPNRRCSPAPAPPTSPMPSSPSSRPTPATTRSGPVAETAILQPRHGRMMVATAGRVLRQLRHDPRTVGLLLVAPVMLIGLLAWVLSGQPGVFDEWGALLLGIFPLLVMFLVTSIATLRERTGGTLE